MVYLSWKDIERIGQDIISEYKKRYVPEKRMCYTVEPMQLAEMLGYHVDFAYLSKKGNILGLTSIDEVCISVLDSEMQVMMYYLDGRSILIDERLRNDPRTVGRLNFSILHEVAHQTLDRMYPEEGINGPRLRCDYRRIPENKPKIKDWREWQADALATVLLLPEDAIKEAMFMCTLGEKMKVLSRKYSQNRYENFCMMAELLGASRSCLSFRMEQLGLLERNLLIKEAKARKGVA